MSYGIPVSDVLTEIRGELQDNGASPRWSDSALLAYINRALRELGRAGCFHCTEVVITDGHSTTYVLGKEPVRVEGVWFNGRMIDPGRLSDMERQYGPGWATITGTWPKLYFMTQQIRLFPIPGVGTAIATSGSPSLTHSVGMGPGGDGYWCATVGGQLEHFFPGDGYITSDIVASNLWVLYSYSPAPVGVTDYLQHRLLTAVENYAWGHALKISDDKSEQMLAQGYLNAFEKEKGKLSAESDIRSREYTPSIATDGWGWERQRIRGGTRSVMIG